MNEYPVSPNLLFDVYVTDSPNAPREFYARVRATSMGEILDMHDAGVSRVLRELIGQGLPESAVYHNGRGRFPNRVHYVTWCGRSA